jgi:hypothetical protein
LYNKTLFLEEEGETFQVKKSTFSRRIHKERKKNKSNDKSCDKDISKNSQNSISHHENNSYQSSPPTSSVTKDSFVKEIQSIDGFSVRLLLFNFTYQKTLKLLYNYLVPARMPSLLHSLCARAHNSLSNVRKNES